MFAELPQPGAPVDLNADVGEGAADDAALLGIVTSASIACGGHAGTPETMAATIALARAGGVAAGAHPSYPDRDHFGRRELPFAVEAIARFVGEQIEALAAVAAAHGVALRHVKPHGALYNVAARDREVAEAIAGAVRAMDRTLILFGLAGSCLIEAGQRAGLLTVGEAFADRAYRADGSLVPRSEAGAVIHDPETIGARAVEMVRTRSVAAIDGTRVPIAVETLCLHSDTPGAAELARRVRAALEAAGIVIRAPHGE